MNNKEKYIVKIRTGEQLEREQFLLCFKSKSQLASMIIDEEEKIDKALKKINNMFDVGDENKVIDDLLELERILKGDK